MLAYLAPDENNVLNVWIEDLEGSSEPALITSDEKRGIRHFLWTYDSQNVLYIQDKDGDENWHLYLTNLESKGTRDLTPYENVVATIISYEPEFPTEALIALNKRNPTVFDVYRIDLSTAALELVAENNLNEIQWVADHQLQVRASTAYAPDGNTILRIRDDQGSPWLELMQWSPLEEGRVLTFSSNGDALYLATNANASSIRLLKVNLADRSQEVIASDPNYDLLGEYQPEVMINPITQEIEAIAVNRERLEWIFLDPKFEADFSFLQQDNKTLKLSSGEFVDETLKVISRDLSDEHWIVKYSSDVHAGHFFLYDRTTQESRFLFHSKSKLDEYHSFFCEMTPISFEARDGMKLHGYLTLPTGSVSKNLPTVLFVHGGPWARDSWGFQPFVQLFANRGYAVLQINYRGSTGYGKEYLNAGNREWAGKMHTDLIDGKEWLVKQGIANPDKVAIAGGSYGGYATLVGLTFTPKEFACGVDIVGPSNLVSLLETFPPYWAPIRTLFDVRIGKEKEFLESRSPLFKADQICRPLFIAQGANDPRVKQSESDQIVAAMRKSGKEVEYLLISDEGHGFARPENSIEFAGATEAFLHKHLGGRAE
jgi:dipeptidyl aminopeptidase/acylaminoacyl peptidase